jgi:hypothetical protein
MEVIWVSAQAKNSENQNIFVKAEFSHLFRYLRKFPP